MTSAKCSPSVAKGGSCGMPRRVLGRWGAPLGGPVGHSEAPDGDGGAGFAGFNATTVARGRALPAGSGGGPPSSPAKDAESNFAMSNVAVQLRKQKPIDTVRHEMRRLSISMTTAQACETAGECVKNF